MRTDTILMVLGVAVVAAATYFILETTIEQREPQLAQVVPDEPRVLGAGETSGEQKTSNGSQTASNKTSGSSDKAGAEHAGDKAEGSGAEHADKPADAGSEKSEATSSSEHAGEPADGGSEHAGEPAAGEGQEHAGEQVDAQGEEHAGAKAESGSSEHAGEAAQGSGQDKAEKQQLVATATINVRAGAGTEHDVVGQVDPGTTVTVLEAPGNEWIRIRHNDLEGWAYRPLFEQP